MTASAMIGAAAAVLSGLCWLPQVWKTLRHRAVRDLSLGTNLLILLTMTLWLIYGALTRDPAIVIANLFSALCVGAIVVAKLMWGRE